jgi:transcriptional regulator with XRE-family HTH domain
MNLKSKIEHLCKKAGMSFKSLASEIPIAEQTLHRNMKRNSMETKYLVRIAEIFNIKMTYFFEEGDQTIDMVNDEKMKYKKPLEEKYKSCLEELRDLNMEIRELYKRIRELETGNLKKPLPESNQKSTIG